LLAVPWSRRGACRGAGGRRARPARPPTRACLRPPPAERATAGRSRHGPGRAACCAARVLRAGLRAQRRGCRRCLTCRARADHHEQREPGQRGPAGQDARPAHHRVDRAVRGPGAPEQRPAALLSVLPGCCLRTTRVPLEEHILGHPGGRAPRVCAGVGRAARARARSPPGGRRPSPSTARMRADPGARMTDEEALTHCAGR